jgi:hypothetical protein
LRGLAYQNVCSFLAKNGEVNDSDRCGFSRPKTADDYGRMGGPRFSPLLAQELRQPPTYDDWMRMSHSHLGALSLACKILGMTKEELKKFVRENGDDTALNELLQRLTSTRNTFECFWHVARTAKARLVCAARRLSSRISPRTPAANPRRV